MAQSKTQTKQFNSSTLKLARVLVYSQQSDRGLVFYDQSPIQLLNTEHCLTSMKLPVSYPLYQAGCQYHHLVMVTITDYKIQKLPDKPFFAERNLHDWVLVNVTNRCRRHVIILSSRWFSGYFTQIRTITVPHKIMQHL